MCMNVDRWSFIVNSYWFRTSRPSSDRLVLALLVQNAVHPPSTNKKRRCPKDSQSIIWVRLLSPESHHGTSCQSRLSLVLPADRRVLYFVIIHFFNLLIPFRAPIVSVSRSRTDNVRLWRSSFHIQTHTDFRSVTAY